MRRASVLFPIVALLAACRSDAGSAEKAAGKGSDSHPFVASAVVTLNSPWAMAFLPDGRMLVTEKAGRLLLLSADGSGQVPVDGVPKVDSAGQGGLMDVVLHPRFAQNRLVYFSYSEAGRGGKGVVLARGVFTDGARPVLADVRAIFRASPYVGGNGHYSGRIAFSPDGHLFFTSGERQKFDPAQDPSSTLGKVLRLNDDGSPAAGNPLAARGFDPAIWSYGHRNLLGLAFDASGNLWEQEMGPRGGDEVNLILPGRNYGWPRASNGSHYDGRDIPDHRPGDGFEAPKLWWNPSISPAGLIIYSGALFPQWRGDAFIGGLSSEALIRVDLKATTAAKGDQWAMGARIRDVEQGPDGAIWLIEDGPGGRLLKLTPK